MNLSKKFLVSLILASFLLSAFTVVGSSISAEAQISGQPSGYLPENTAVNVENVSENAYFQLWPNAEYHIEDNASADVYLENIPPENSLPLKSADWSVDVSSPSSGSLQVQLDTSTTMTGFMAEWLLKKEFTFEPLDTENLETWLGYIDNTVINTILNNRDIEGKKISEVDLENRFDTVLNELPSKYADLIESLSIENTLLKAQDNVGNYVIDDATCTRFQWNGNENNLEFDLDITISNIGLLERSGIRSRLSVSENITYSFNGEKISLESHARGDNDQFDFSLNATRDGNNWNGSFEFTAQGDLPRSGNKVAINYPVPVPIPTFLPPSVDNIWQKVRQNWLDDPEIVVRFRASKYANVNNIPSNYDDIPPYPNHLEWLDDNAIDAAISIANRDNVPKVGFDITEAATGSATGVGTSDATLNATIELGSYSSVNTWFRYRKAGSSSWDNNTTPVSVSSTSYKKTISGLSSSTTYEFQVAIGKTWWTDNGDISTFTTSTPPTPPGPEPPVADSNGPYTVLEESSIELDGTGSYDPDGTSLTYSWTITDDPTGGASLTNASTSTPTFHAPSVDTDTDVSVQLSVTDNDGATDTDTTTVTVKTLPPAPSSAQIENMTPENAAENLSRSDPDSAARTLENIPPENTGSIINASVEQGITDNMARILNRMTPESSAAGRHSANTTSAATTTEAMARDNINRAARSAEAGAKENLSREAEIMNEVETGPASDIIRTIFDLPETPQAAANLLGAMNVSKSTGVVSHLIDGGYTNYVSEMFSLLDSQVMNSIYEGLSVTERGTIWPELSGDVQGQILDSLAPRFEASDLSLSKTEVSPGETTEISVLISNTGGTPSSYTVEFVIDGSVEYEETVELDPEDSETLTYETSKTEPGTYTVEVDGQTIEFEVVEEVAPPEEEGIVWWVWVVVAIVVIMVIAGIVLVMQKRR